ncbi:para-aminobenzoic acid synthetase [Crepidotus variabilis]|uniref:aminodeoxychorismate synthase n=1 Tax=Crepidotus variabilis TaxID=179855 RepID=A0A9P6JWW5_9AGAR|nr:para-aminobenzoic acid synthetase [Crepidotus variabilis]
MAIDTDQPRLLLVDSYDSFTHNLAALFSQAIRNCSITIIKNDELGMQALRPYLAYFDAVIVGPGPGSPDNDEDVGIVKHLWRMHDEDLLPVFGVCLGLQSLAIEHGATLKRLNTVKHGMISQIRHTSTDLFQGLEGIRATRYHSICVELQAKGLMEELGWVEDEENGRVVMAVRHATRPFWAVQYHPESVCTDNGGLRVIQNFWLLAKSWSTDHCRRTEPWSSRVARFGSLWPSISSTTAPRSSSPELKVITTSFQQPDLSVVDICEAFGASKETSKFAVLESASQPGRFSIIAALSHASLHVRYRVGDVFITLQRDGQSTEENLGSLDIYAWIGRFMKTKVALDGHADLPFWGGLIGYLSYELGVQSLDIPLRRETTTQPNKQPDVNLVFVERSVVRDSQSGRVYVQSIAPDDHVWVNNTETMLKTLVGSSQTETSLSQGKPNIIFPNKIQYISRIQTAQDHLAAGDSYEICLTAQTRVSIPSTPVISNVSSSWERYKRLLKSNPAPHSAYLRLHPSTLLSSSPERFLSYTRPPGTLCQLRPIKGTVRKAPHISRAMAEKLLVGSPKEVAENLMIVDLIRHDLHGVVGRDVKTKQFCSVEEYETVWQLVSVIEGRLPYDSALGAEDQLGWQVLQRSLPPGSMTGAPKKRSVEILQTLEDQERSIYSGVFGYWCVSGAGDWSVVIRSAFKYDNRFDEETSCSESSTTEEWVIGAGGAITALSDPESEWEEMEMKLNSVLRAFGVLPT